MSKLPTQFAGFTVLPVIYSADATHVLYARAHVGSKKAKNTAFPEGRTLFVVNLPPDATERELVLLFKHAGTVEKVVFDQDTMEEETLESESEEEEEDQVVAESSTKKRRTKLVPPPPLVPIPTTSLRTFRRTGRSVHVVFLDNSSLARALAAPKPRPWPVQTEEEPRGLAHYMALHDSLRPPLDAVKAHADSAMDLYEYEVAKKKRKSKYRKGEAVVDEDGFTLVTRGGAYGQSVGGGVGVASKRFQKTGQTSGRTRKKKDTDVKEGFYAFQKAEKQRKHIMDLKKNWELDKQKVEKLKESRRFKPY